MKTQSIDRRNEMSSHRNSSSRNPSSLKYRRLRAPMQHGQAMHDPPRDVTATVWERNKKTVDGFDFLVAGRSAHTLQKAAQAELLTLATNYTSQYRDTPDIAGSDGVILSGHQPKLFHPGVWYKNFVLSDFHNRLNAVGINLVVDNDICGLPQIVVPSSPTNGSADARPVVAALKYDLNYPNVPFENRTIQDSELFDSFASRVNKSLGDQISNPLVSTLWGYATRFRGIFEDRLGAVVAAARHRMEQDFGLQTLEIPLSQVCNTESFCCFVIEILNRVSEFHEIYNRTLSDYRDLHGIRSRSHPVPELESDGRWFETPFWIWSIDRPTRKRLFVRLSGNELILSDGDDLHVSINSEDPVEQLYQQLQSKLAIRTRSLTTTMYSRLILSQMFIHGIGGAKYDQLTDEIARQFFGVAPPEFLAITATMRLPIEKPNANQADVCKAKFLLREMKFHPEQHLDLAIAENEQLASEKRRWIDEDLPENRRERHAAISQLNQTMTAKLSDRCEKLQREIDELEQLSEINRALSSREFCFAVFPQSLPAQLSQLAGGDNVSGK